jgi:hypothetical protein
MRGVGKDDLLAPRFSPVPGLWERESMHPAIDGVARGLFRERAPPEIRGGGYVAASLEAALWAFDRSSTFEEGVLLAVNLGDDADTTGAVFGGLAGAYYGIDRIPGRWRAGLARADLIERFADGLVAHRPGGSDDLEGDELGRLLVLVRLPRGRGMPGGAPRRRLAPQPAPEPFDPSHARFP